MVPERHNAVKVLLFLDIGGSMDDHIRVCEQLFSAARLEFKHLEYFYFHNFLYERVWKDNRRRATQRMATWDVLHTYPHDYKVILVGDATMSPYEITYPGGSVEHTNEEAGAVWLQRLLSVYHNTIWLNPQPEPCGITTIPYASRASSWASACSRSRSKGSIAGCGCSARRLVNVGAGAPGGGLFVVLRGKRGRVGILVSGGTAGVAVGGEELKFVDPKLLDIISAKGFRARAKGAFRLFGFRGLPVWLGWGPPLLEGVEGMPVRLAPFFQGGGGGAVSPSPLFWLSVISAPCPEKGFRFVFNG